MLEFQQQKLPLIKCSPAKTTAVYRSTLECLGLKLLPKKHAFFVEPSGVDGGVNPMGAHTASLQNNFTACGFEDAYECPFRSFTSTCSK